MKTLRLLGISAGLMGGCIASAGVLVTFNGGSATGQNIGLNYSVTQLTAGTELTGYTATGSGDPGDAYEASNWTTDSNSDLDSAFVFTVTPEAGYSLNLTKITFSFRPDGSGPRAIGVRVALGVAAATTYVAEDNDDNSPAGTPDVYKTWATYERLGSFGGGMAQPITVYIIGFDSQQPNRAMAIDNITLEGDLTAVPEPGVTSAIFGAVSLGAVVALRRRRQA